MSADVITTDAGRQLLAMLPIIGGYQPDTQAMLIAAIEAEAYERGRQDAEAKLTKQAADRYVAALLAELEALPTGIPRITGDPFLQEAWQQGWESGRVTVLDLIRKAGAPKTDTTEEGVTP